MNCPECFAANSKNAIFCEICGAPLTAPAMALLRQRDIREKQTREIELTEAVFTRLWKWVRIFLFFAAIPVVAFGVVLGKGCSDTQKAIQNGRGQINEAVTSGTSQIHTSLEVTKSTITTLQNNLPAIATQIDQLQRDASKYKRVNEHIAKLQGDLSDLQGAVVDLGHKTIRAESFETTGNGVSTIAFKNKGCPQKNIAGTLVTYCAQGFPLALNQLTPDHPARPVASFSTTGFQDMSKSVKQSCDETLRGTLYVEKGTIGRADKAFLCVKDSMDKYLWMQIETTR